MAVCPKSGEMYHGESKAWSDSSDLQRMVEKWLDTGAGNFFPAPGMKGPAVGGRYLIVNFRILFLFIGPDSPHLNSTVTSFSVRRQWPGALTAICTGMI